MMNLSWVLALVDTNPHVAKNVLLRTIASLGRDPAEVRYLYGTAMACPAEEGPLLRLLQFLGGGAGT